MSPSPAAGLIATNAMAHSIARPAGEGTIPAVPPTVTFGREGPCPDRQITQVGARRSHPQHPVAVLGGIVADRKLNEAERKAVLRGLIWRRRKAHEDQDQLVEEITSARINSLLDEAINARAN